uniref:Acyltransferase 3 domain-containing protein n=1 Tax=Megaselia scalaris TaxID=36166 RepID=T1GXL7_MEGSC
MFESFGKIGWGFMMSWVVFACYHGYGGVVDSFLSNPLWQPFARMSFTMYLAHIAIMDVLDGNAQTSEYFSNFQSILKFWSHFGITILVSIALVLAVESPIIGLEKIILSGKSKKPQLSNKANPANNEAFVADENQEKNSRDFA